ncbi:MAG: peptide-methionine (R)-S-oxide reductase MsrB [Granulosicoccus sp.]
MTRLTAIAGLVLGFGLTSSAILLPTLSGDGIASEALTETHGDATTVSALPDSKQSKGRSAVTAVAYNADDFVKPSDAALKEKLSPLEYKVTQHDGTERAFSNALHDEKRVGLYVDIVSGEPLFSSTDKYDSGTGWPSFSRPIHEDAVVEKEDRSLFGARIEIRSALADSHLGHVFNDGPASTGTRYCMNSAAMRFIPMEDMAASGYGAYLEFVSESKVSS